VTGVNALTVYKRGFWLNGSNAYLDIDQLFLHHTFTIMFWVKVYDGQNLYSISQNHRNTIGQEDFFNWDLAANALHFRYK
jgi:hypothetical protein